MRVEMASDGRITIITESGAEEFAMEEWRRQNFIQQEDLKRAEVGHWKGSSIAITSQENYRMRNTAR